jgi:class 3 adenylate cyclase/pimeloyl-ACP methyl ester carboxylesterase
MEQPETRYVAVGDADVAYQVIGDGEIDLLYCYGLGSHLEMFWEVPETADYLERLASFSRLIFFDRRGTGASDGIARNAIPTWEEWTEDVIAVLDAVGSERAAILASLDAGPIAMMFAAMHPERVSSLILLNASARPSFSEDYPIGLSPEDVETFVSLVRETWGSLEMIRLTNPSLPGDSDLVRGLARVVRCSATPRTAAAQFDVTLRGDARPSLPLVQAPTLVLHSRDNPIVPVAHGHFLADNIEGARFVELPGGDIGLTPAMLSVIGEVAEFITGERAFVEVDRILTTVLFTDIVGSTERAADLGDERWRRALDEHDRAVRDQLRRFHGREVNTTGDGFVAAFDGPARAIQCGRAIIDATARTGLELRMGLHTGECEVRGEDLGGLSVHIAARVGALAGPGEILVSGTVKDLVIGSDIDFIDRGERELKGVPGKWRLFAVVV